MTISSSDEYPFDLQMIQFATPRERAGRGVRILCRRIRSGKKLVQRDDNSFIWLHLHVTGVGICDATG
jgi:hypothetical protein